MRLEGKAVALKMKQAIYDECQRLRREGEDLTVAIMRVGSNEEDIAYQNRVIKNCAETGLGTKEIGMPENVAQEVFLEQLDHLNKDNDIKGILVLRPLPKHLDETQISRSIAQEKDIDCMSPANLTNLFMGYKDRISPCTPEAVIEMLKHYEVPIAGKHVVIVNRSLVLGKPLMLLFLEEDATVTVCHSKTEDLESVTRTGDIVVTGVGRPGFFGASYFKPEATVVDVGINFADGKMCGDVRYDEVSEHVCNISPVPGGVGTVTSMVLLRHCIREREV